MRKPPLMPALLIVAVFLGVVVAVGFGPRGLFQAKPQFGWKQINERAITFTTAGPSSGVRWQLTEGAGRKLRFVVNAEQDVAFSATECADHGATFTVECSPQSSTFEAVIRDARPNDISAYVGAIISSTARERIAAPNRVHLVLYAWDCIANCSK